MSSATQSSGSGKILYVEALRGIACILLVFYHVIGDTSSNGLQLPLDHPYALFNRLFTDLRMPLFSFISGFIFSAYARDIAMLQGKILAKARRLLLPMVVVGTLHYWTQYAFAPDAGGQPPFVNIFFLPYEHFWFLQATFSLMLVVFLTTWLLKGDDVRATVLLLVVGLVGSTVLSRWSPDIFSAYKGFYLAPYFLTGYLASHAAPMRRLMEAGSRNRPVLIVFTLALLALFWVEFLLQSGALDLVGAERRGFGNLMGLVACITLFLYRIDSRFLSFIGTKSYAIFLLHVFFTAGSRIVLTKIFPNISLELLMAAGLLSGVAGPICVAWLAQRNPVSALLLLGIRQRPNARPPADRPQAAE